MDDFDSDFAGTEVDGQKEVSDLEHRFNCASTHVRSLAAKLKQDDLLYLYGRFKLVTDGPCTSKRPGLFDPSGRRKWDAYESASAEISRDDAMRQYVTRVASLDAHFTVEARPSDARDKGSGALGVRPSVMEAEEDGEHESLDEQTEAGFGWIWWAKQDDSDISEVEKWANKFSSTNDVNRSDAEGMTAVHWAADRGALRLLRLLLSRGADVNSRASDGQTALHFAVSCGHTDIVKLLIDEGADNSIIDEDGQAAIDLCDCEDIRTLINGL